MPLPPGMRLGAYVIDAPLGAGGMGEVYRDGQRFLIRTSVSDAPNSYVYIQNWPALLAK